MLVTRTQPCTLTTVQQEFESSSTHATDRRRGRIRQGSRAFTLELKALSEGRGSPVAAMTLAEHLVSEAQASAPEGVDESYRLHASAGACIGHQVASARDARGWTQQRLADEMNALGFSWKRLTVTEVERNTRRITPDELIPLAALLVRSVPSLLTPPEHFDLIVNECELPRDAVRALLWDGKSAEVKAAAQLVVALLRARDSEGSKE